MAQCEQMSATSGSLLRAKFLSLSDALRKAPERAYDPVPEMWIDGCGQLLHIDFPASRLAAECTVNYDHMSPDEEEILEMGCKACKDLHYLIQEILPDWEDTTPDEPPNNATLIQLWAGLRDLLWNYWRRHDREETHIPPYFRISF